MGILEKISGVTFLDHDAYQTAGNRIGRKSRADTDFPKLTSRKQVVFKGDVLDIFSFNGGSGKITILTRQLHCPIFDVQMIHLADSLVVCHEYCVHA
jgi:hypothetical protein